MSSIKCSTFSFFFFIFKVLRHSEAASSKRTHQHQHQHQHQHHALHPRLFVLVQQRGNRPSKDRCCCCGGELFVEGFVIVSVACLHRPTQRSPISQRQEIPPFFPRQRHGRDVQPRCGERYVCRAMEREFGNTNGSFSDHD